MKKETITFATESHNGVITSIGRSSIYTPPIAFRGGEIKWFDDSRLLKKTK